MRRLIPVLSLLAVSAAPPFTPFAVTDMTPAPDSVLSTPPSEILISLDTTPDALSVNTNSVVLTRAGGDGMLGTGDDVTIAPASVTVVSTTVIRIDLAAVPLPNDLYQVRIRGDAPAIPGLVSHYPLDDGAGTTATDASGGGYPGAVSGASWTTGRLGGGLSFNGLDNRVVIGAPQVPVPWSAAMWVYRLDSPSADARLTDNIVPGGTSLRLEQYNGTNQVGYTNNGVADYTLGYIVPVGVWTHLAFTCTAGGVTLYANGSPVGANAASVPLTRGALGSGGFNTMLGSLDDVRFYNRILSASEVLTLAQLGGAVRELGGGLLDGEFAGTFPSGDSAPGGDFLASFRINTLAPLAPTLLTAVGTASAAIRLAWTDNSITETGFKIERSADGVAFSQIAVAAADAESYDDTTVSADTAYFYRVRATSGAGDSSYTNIASGRGILVTEKKKCGLLGIEALAALGLLALARRGLTRAAAAREAGAECRRPRD